MEKSVFLIDFSASASARPSLEMTLADVFNRAMEQLNEELKVGYLVSGIASSIF